MMSELGIIYHIGVRVLYSRRLVIVAVIVAVVVNIYEASTTSNLQSESSPNYYQISS